MDTNKLSDMDGKEKTKRRKQPDRKATKGKNLGRKNEIMDYKPLIKTEGADEDNMSRLKQPIPGELLKGDEIMDCSKPSTQTEGVGEENMSTLNQPIQGEMLKGNIVLEKNKSMDSNKISTKTEEADKENMNRFKQPIQGESLKGNIFGKKSEIVDSNKLSKKAVEDDEVNVIRSLKQPMQGESLEGSIQKGKNEMGADNKRNFNMLLDIHPYSFKWNLQARVQQKNVNYWQSKKKVKLLLIDAEGTRMEACIQNKDVDKFENKIQEGKVYSFVGVRAELSPPEYKLADQRFQCLLTKETIVEEEEDEHGIPKYCFDFKSLDKLVPFVGSKSVLIDTIAVVRDVSPIYYRKFDGINVAKRDVILVDKTLTHKRLIVSGSLATVDEDEWDFASAYSTVILTTALVVNKFEDTEFLCTTNNSRLMFEPSVIDVDDFRGCVLNKLGRSKIVLVSTGVTRKKAINLEDATKITVSDLKGPSNLKNGLYEVICDISRVYHARGHDLWYMSCVACSTKLVEGGDAKYQCRKCNASSSDGCLRFILKLKIMDHTADHDLTIFGGIGENLLGCMAKQLNDMKNKDNYDDMLVERLKSITWVKYNFFFSIGARGSNDVNLVYVKRTDQ